jgi:hypothetical protein
VTPWVRGRGGSSHEQRRPLQEVALRVPLAQVPFADLAEPPPILGDARRTLGIAWRYYDELEQLGARLLRARMDEREFERFLSRLVPLPPPQPDASNAGRAVRNAERVREAIRGVYRGADDLADVRGTHWGALQAVAAYVDHTQPTRQTAGRSTAEARFERATEPQPLKDRALALLTADGQLV